MTTSTSAEFGLRLIASRAVMELDRLQLSPEVRQMCVEYLEARIEFEKLINQIIHQASERRRAKNQRIRELRSFDHIT